MGEKRYFATEIIVGALVLLSGYLMIGAARGDSAIIDELAHIPAGYGYVKFFDYRLNPEHPPLVKALAALPLAFMDLNFPTGEKSWKEDVNGQWTAGAQFLYESGNDADRVIFYARLGPILLTLLLILVTYFWAAQLLGRWWAILPTFLLALSPTILAHGHYVTTDVGAALGVVIATWTFTNWLAKPNQKTLIMAGAAFGVAQLLKFSAVLLIPFFAALAVIFWIKEAAEKLKHTGRGTKIKYLVKSGLRHLGGLMGVFLIGSILIYAVYFIFTFNQPIEKQARDTEIILTSFAGGPAPAGEWCRPARCLAEINIWMAGNSVTRPAAQYLLGVLMVGQRAAGGNTAYFLGEVGGGGWPHYFPVVYLLKEPLPVLLLIVTGFLLALIRIKRTWQKEGWQWRDYLNTNWAELAMVVFVIGYWLYSIRSPLNIGVRHILPTVPLIYILTASALKKWVELPRNRVRVENWWQHLAGTIKLLMKISVKLLAVSAMMLWLMFETLAAAPFFLSYFNQLGGGVENGYRFVTDSNYDWGQDLKRLEALAEELKIDKIGVDYFGGGSPKRQLGDRFEPWWSARNDPRAEGIRWLAVSINTLQGAVADPAPGFERKPEDGYLWLKTARNLPVTFSEPPPPDYRAGMSIFVYDLGE